MESLIKLLNLKRDVLAEPYWAVLYCTVLGKERVREFIKRSYLICLCVVLCALQLCA